MITTADEYVATTGRAGGPLEAASLDATCPGFVPRAPSHRVELATDARSLVFRVQSAIDTVIVVRTPSGGIVCDDDGGGYPNPRVATTGTPGRYEVWVGTYSPGQSSAYVFYAQSTDAVVTAPSATISAIAGVPSACGMTVPDYGPIAIGSGVVLGAHTGWTGPNGHGDYVADDTWWNDLMWPFVGQATVVTALGGLDPVGCPYVHTAIDGEMWGWRIRDLAPVIRASVALPTSPDVRGALSREQIREVVRLHLDEVRRCYDGGLASRPELAGRVTVAFVISPTGTVTVASVASTTLGAPQVEDCIVQAVRAWTFPPPDGGGVVAVNYPFVLESSE